MLRTILTTTTLSDFLGVAMMMLWVGLLYIYLLHCARSLGLLSGFSSLWNQLWVCSWLSYVVIMSVVLLFCPITCLAYWWWCFECVLVGYVLSASSLC